MIVQNYDDEIWQLNNDVSFDLVFVCSVNNEISEFKNKDTNNDYDEDVHYPLLLKLCKRDTNNGFCKMVL